MPTCPRPTDTPPPKMTDHPPVRVTSAPGYSDFDGHLMYTTDYAVDGRGLLSVVGFVIDGKPDLAVVPSRCVEIVTPESQLAAIRALFERRWDCRVVSSGYHTGAHCDPSDPHGSSWNCGHRWIAARLTDDEARYLGIAPPVAPTPEEVTPS